VPRLNRTGKGISRVLEWLLNRDVPDGEIGSALNLAKATYSRRKDAHDYPNYAELTALGKYFGISPRVLQIAFGWRVLRVTDLAHGGVVAGEAGLGMR
jgi:hypothetical protein